MAQLAGIVPGFNPRTVEPTRAFEAIPAGWYRVMIDEEPKMKPTSKPGGQMLVVRMNVMDDGPYKNQKLWSRLNLINSSEDARTIAQRELSAICHATGKLDVVDTVELMNIPMWAKVAVRPSSKNEESGKEYEASNEIKAFKHINDPTMANGPATAPATAGVAIPGAGGVTLPPVAGAVALPPVTQQVAAPAVPATPVAPPVMVAPPQPVPPPQPVYTMLIQDGLTREAYHAAGWNDEILVQHGKMSITMPTPVAPTAPAVPGLPPVPGQPAWAGMPAPTAPPAGVQPAQQAWAQPAAPAAPAGVAEAAPPWHKPS